MALSWDNQAPIAFEKNNYPAPFQMEELFGERRTIRDFKQEKIDRKSLQRLSHVLIMLQLTILIFGL